MPGRQPALGSAAVFTPPSDLKTVHVDQSTCFNLSVFKELMREYRKVDDNVTMRLNRTVAQFRDRDRQSTSNSSSKSPDEEACAFFWKDLVSNWKRRTEIAEYCVDVMDRSMEKKRQTFEKEDVTKETKRRLKDEHFEEEVKRNQIHNELAIEAIIRQRSFDAFKNRCKFFVPPSSDAEARIWWEKASKGGVSNYNSIFSK
ncbi:caffeine-induced death [Pyrrhoderma noxium]|uniref:Caffeine-induced death n=1 Tax=Pyrrhoderma noxium TaxID=2282107 RepID=A0A286UNX0_9AGAM|nr:caffeine-induced death [Pyrrhoderma noxium]